MDLSELNSHFGLGGPSGSTLPKPVLNKTVVKQTQDMTPHKKRRKRGKKKVIGCTEIYIIENNEVVYCSFPTAFSGVLEMPMKKLNGQKQATLSNGNEVYELVSAEGFRLKLFCAIKYELSIGHSYTVNSFRTKGTTCSCVLKD